MKREGRQHGMVRTCEILPSFMNPRPEPRTVIRSTRPTTAGIFMRVASKPTNHSKFTGKCGRPRCNKCHAHPASKSKDKAKGTKKLRSYDDHRMLTWRVVDDGLSGLIFDGYSATEILDHLSYDAAGKNKNNGGGNESDEIESEQGNKVVIEDIDDDENDDFVSFFVVGHVWDQCVVSDEDEGWCVVGK